MRSAERWAEHTRQLKPLIVGDYVRVQNQVGPHPNKWDKTGLVIEVRQFDQYLVRMDGSGRVSLRNRKFLRKYVPVHPAPPRHTISQDAPDTQHPRVMPVQPKSQTLKSKEQPVMTAAPMPPSTVVGRTPSVPLGQPAVTDTEVPASPVHHRPTPAPSVPSPGPDLAMPQPPPMAVTSPTVKTTGTAAPASPRNTTRSGRIVKPPKWLADYET